MEYLEAGEPPRAPLLQDDIQRYHVSQMRNVNTLQMFVLSNDNVGFTVV
jgi:hypothetical protein